ncbi:P-loop containing nucleoside triphosphate hydrolase protein [Dactylonectria macrodidyma]|uniref:P-loop containing nucleoside triphosphate hydrolase protein n=1 Tax=Dactylonectria macrodidyma TaxID=307937 RepID=A0A9P9FQK1_9HYPO|nr:P-loop containing nucleoside triphosphate hydrolase protein [Dactylonectria macrodidyma]
MSSMLCINDGAFGPSVQGCRGDFDFTQKFERIFFSIIPASVFVAAAIARVVVLSQGPRIVGGQAFQYLKLAIITAYSITQLALLALFITGAPDVVHGLSVAGSALVFVASAFAIALSYAEHSRARRPSALLNIYILLTLIFDIVQARTAWLIIASWHQTILARLFTSSIAVKVIILCLEAVPKTRWIHWNASEHSPEESSSVFSLGVYYWLNRLFWHGYRDVLVIDDLYPLDAGMASQGLYDKLAPMLRIHQYHKELKFGLCRDIGRTLAGPLLAPIAPRIALIGFKFCQPFFIRSILLYLQSPDDPTTDNHGYGLIGACFLIYIGIAFSSAWYTYYNQKAAYMVRGCLSAAVYRKTTQTKLTAADDAAAVTLMSTDIERIVKGCTTMHEIWAGILEVALGCWLLERQLGAAFASPIVIIFVCIGILAWELTFVGKRQGAWMSSIQNRVGLTSNAISNMKLYKISGVTEPVAKLIQSLRQGEIKLGNRFRWLLILAAGLGFTPICLSPVVTFAVTSKSLRVETLFTSYSYILLVTGPLVLVFQSLPHIFAAITCTQRIQKFIADEPRIDTRKMADVSSSTTSNTEKDSSVESGDTALAFKIEAGTFGWGGEKMTLSQINTSIPTNQLTFVIGEVASGKSTFCKVLLGELPVSSGTVTAFVPLSRIGYCEQTPFLYNATFKENIIGHCAFDQDKYDEIIDATLLNSDVALLPDGHDTKIGNNGIMLSGGQKQRVSVARALYSESDVMIFDDVLSGLDNDTEAELFRRVFGPGSITRKRNVTVVICTHSIRHLPTADHIIALETGGTIVEQGTFQDLKRNNKYVQSLGVKEETPRSHTELPREQQTAMVPKTTSNEIKAALEDRARQLGDWSIYSHYARSVGFFPVSLLILSAVVYGVGANLSTVWMKFWSEDAYGKSVGFYVGIFGLCRVLAVLFILVNATSTHILMISYSGTVLHQRAITTVVTAPLRFFTTTDSGIVTNLFSQDMTLLDGELPMALTNVTIELADCIGMAFVIASASPYLAIAYPVLLAVLYFVQMFYLRTSRQIRLLDLESKSPLYTHFLDTINGIATIRAFGWENLDIKQNNKLLDTSQRPAYLLAMIQQWLMTTLNLIVTGIAVLLVSLATQLNVNTGLTGASLVTLLTFSESISNLIRAYTTLETSLGAVSRLRTFSNTVKPENQPDENIEPPPEWPQGGRIDIKEVSASYGSECESESGQVSASPPNLVVRDLTLTILPRQKVAICGRTGSGKSSLILLLLRLLDPLPSCDRNMEIDGTPLNRIDRTTLRKRIIAIPQDAVFLPDGSTIKANIDPFDVATAQECLDVLTVVRLASFVDDRGGLDTGMNAEDLSAGQKQLFSLGRAILRRRVRSRFLKSEKSGGVLLLDEVSSSVDKATDRAMQEIIRQEFESYTIVMVSHRLEMVVDFFDSVVVLDKGAVVESGSPRELIETPGSRFHELWSIENRNSDKE